MKDRTTSGVIYHLHNGDGVTRYIGYTTQAPKRRLNQHRNDLDRHPRRHLTHWIRKHGPENIQMVVVETYESIPLSELKQIEVDRIAQGLEAGLKLINGTKGGDGGTGRPLSEDHKRRISEAHKGKETSEAERKRRSEFMKGKPAHNKGKPNPSQVLNMHNRWHVNRNIIKDGCSHCASAQERAA